MEVSSFTPQPFHFITFILKKIPYRQCLCRKFPIFAFTYFIDFVNFLYYCICISFYIMITSDIRSFCDYEIFRINKVGKAIFKLEFFTFTKNNVHFSFRTI
jgi:hypothetical protein